MADVYVRGLAEVAGNLRAVPEKLARNVMRSSLRRGARVIQIRARANVNKVSGELARGLKISTSVRNGVAKATLRATRKHAFVAHIIEWTGAKPHTIRAKGDGWLYFGGQFVKEVQHPGIPKRPFLRPALDAEAGRALVAVATSMRDQLATKGGLDTAGVEIVEV